MTYYGSRPRGQKFVAWVNVDQETVGTSSAPAQVVVGSFANRQAAMAARDRVALDLYGKEADLNRCSFDLRCNREPLSLKEQWEYIRECAQAALWCYFQGGGGMTCLTLAGICKNRVSYHSLQSWLLAWLSSPHHVSIRLSVCARTHLQQGSRRVRAGPIARGRLHGICSSDPSVIPLDGWQDLTLPTAVVLCCRSDQHKLIVKAGRRGPRGPRSAHGMGVYLRQSSSRTSKPYIARIIAPNGKLANLGSHPTAEAAQRAYDRAFLAMHGRDAAVVGANVNFSPEEYPEEDGSEAGIKELGELVARLRKEASEMRAERLAGKGMEVAGTRANPGSRSEAGAGAGRRTAVRMAAGEKVRPG